MRSDWEGGGKPTRPRPRRRPREVCYHPTFATAEERGLSERQGDITISAHNLLEDEDEDEDEYDGRADLTTANHQSGLMLPTLPVTIARDRPATPDAPGEPRPGTQ